MRSKLVSSLLTVTLFWWVLLFAIWGLHSPSSNLADLGWARPVAALLGIALPERAGWFDGIKVQGLALLVWTAPILLGGVLAFIAGFRSAWEPHKESFEAGEVMKESGAGVRGVSATMGDLPGFPALAREDLEFDDAYTGKLTPQEKDLLSAIFSVLVAHPDARPGDGHTSIVDQAEALALRELTDGGANPGLSAIAAVSRLMGNIRAYSRNPDSGAWQQDRPSPARTAELMLVSLPEWWALPEEVRIALSWAVGFWDDMDEIPIAPPAISRMALNILRQAKDLDKEMAAQASQAAVEQTKKEFDLIELLLSKLPTLPFQNGLPKGVHAVGWRKGNMVYLMENQLIDKYILPSIPAERRKALQEVGKGHKLSNLSRELMNLLKARGWLVTEAAGCVLPVESALWKLQAGKILYKRVIALDFSNSPDIRDMLPVDSFYPVTLTEPHFDDGAVTQVFAARDLGGLFRAGGGAGAGGGASKKQEPANSDTAAGVKPARDAGPGTAGAPKPVSAAKPPLAPSATKPAPRSPGATLAERASSPAPIQPVTAPEADPGDAMPEPVSPRTGVSAEPGESFEVETFGSAELEGQAFLQQSIERDIPD